MSLARDHGALDSLICEPHREEARSALGERNDERNGFMINSQSPLLVRIDVDRRINYAMQQNDVPVVKALHIENRTDTPLRDLQIRILAEPAFAQGWTTHLASIGEEATYNVEAIDLLLSPDFLGQLTERVRGQLWIEVTQGGDTLARFAEPVELLAR